MKHLEFCYHVCGNLIYVDFKAYRLMREGFESVKKLDRLSNKDRRNTKAPWPIP